MCCATVLALGSNELAAAVCSASRRRPCSSRTLTVGVAGGLDEARLLRRCARLVFIVPGVLMLVPGSAGFNSIVQLLTDQAVSGINAGFDTFCDGDVDRLRADGLRPSILPRRFHAAGAAHSLESPEPHPREHGRDHQTHIPSRPPAAAERR